MYCLKRNFNIIISFMLLFTLLFPVLGERRAAASSAPITTHNLNGNLNVNGIHYGNVEFELSIVSPGSGISLTRYSLDNGGSWTTYSAPVVFSEKRVYHILYQSVDINNNIETAKEATFTIKKDNFPPETSIAIDGTQGDNSYYIGPVTVSLIGTDAHSSIQSSEYSLNNGQTWNAYSVPILIEQPNTIIYYRSRDIDGNLEKAKKAKIKIDNTPPTAPDFHISPDQWSNSTFTVTLLDGADEQSGTLKSQYRIGDSGAWEDYTVPASVSGDGMVTIYARTIDYAGNSSETSAYTLQFDKLPPTAPEINLNYMDWTNQEVFVTVDGGSDAESSVRGYEYRVGTETDWTEFVDSFIVRDEGITPVYGRTIDMAGNASSVAEGAVKIDLTPPTAPANLFKVNQFGTSALIQWSSGSDSLSGMDQYEVLNGDELLAVTRDRRIQLDNLRPNEKYSITVVSVDMAGNISEDSFPVVFYTNNLTVSGYRDHNFAVDQQGQVWGWGLNNVGQLGDGTTTSRYTATRIPNLDGFSMISTGLTQNIGLRPDGTVWTWGQDMNGNNLSFQKVTGLEQIVSISSGLGHFLALKEDGTVWTWGNNGFGQLGTGNLNSSQTPVEISGLDAVVSISASYYNSMALREDGTVWIWGDSARGILGYDATNEYKQLTPVQIQGLSNIVQIDFSYLHGSALKQDGTVWTWGYNANGQLGDGTTQDHPVPAKVPNLTNVIKVSSSYAHNLALTNEGEVWSWGDNAYGELGDGTLAQSRLVPIQAAHLEGITDVEAAEFYSFATKKDGSIWSWGSNSSGQLGTGTTTQHRTRTLVSGFTYPADTEAPSAPGHLSSTGTTATTAVLSWGEASDNHGVKDYLVYRGTNLIQALNVEDNSIDAVTGYTATGLAPGTTYTFSIKARDYAGNLSLASNEVSVTMEASLPMAVSAGSDQTYALKSDGSVWAWGSNYRGQLGNGTLSPSYTATQTTNLSSMTAVSAGGSYGLSLKSDGSVWGWGDNSFGQTGNAYLSSQQYNPLKVENFGSVVSISAGHTHALALKSDGTVWGWGSNYFGELGLGTSGNNKYIPTKIPSLSGVKAISTGLFFSLAVKNDGTVWAWGMNSNGQLGNGTNSDSLVPVKVNNLINVKSVSAGFYHALALKEDGTVWGWGGNSDGQLGDQTYFDRMSPVNVSSISGIQEISAGMSHSLAKTDSLIYSWGYNASGQLGNNSNYGSNYPVTVSSISSTKHMDAGVGHNAVVTGNVVKTWGSNNNGQLGDGTVRDAKLPVTVIGLVAGQTSSAKTINPNTTKLNENAETESAQSVLEGLKLPDGFVLPDLISPTTPNHVEILQAGERVLLNWDKSKDNIAVKEYWVYVNDKLVLKTELNEGVELKLPDYEVVSINIRAVDRAGNLSNVSLPVSP